MLLACSLTRSVVEDVELGKVGAEVEDGGVVVGPEHFFVRISRAEENSKPGEKKLCAGKLIVPAEDPQIGNG